LSYWRQPLANAADRYIDRARDLVYTVLPCMQQLLVDIPSKAGMSKTELLETELRAVYGFSD
jgi:hypothetical protein